MPIYTSKILITISIYELRTIKRLEYKATELNIVLFTEKIVAETGFDYLHCNSF